MKKCYIISIDRNPSRLYENFLDAIKTYSIWAKITDSTYAVVTNQSTTDVRDHLIQYLNPEDRIFVMKSSGVAAWRHANAADWLQKYLPIT